jgi:hypothetical protein
MLERLKTHKGVAGGVAHATQKKVFRGGRTPTPWQRKGKALRHLHLYYLITTSPICVETIVHI